MDYHNHRFTIILMGDAGVGKTAYCKRLLTGQFEQLHVSTLEVETSSFVIKTNHGDIMFDIWDTAGSAQGGGLLDGVYEADAAILMFSHSDANSFDNVLNWEDQLVGTIGDVPTVVVGTKCDQRVRATKYPKIYRETSNNQYYDISSKSNYNFYKPFIYLASKLTGFDDLCDINDNNIVIPEASFFIDVEQIAVYESELSDALSFVN
jgi:GTP-binding nuclear protein Ran